MASDLQYVRFLISDVDSGDRQVFSDAEILMVIEREPSIKIAAAVLMERIADNEVLIAKVIRTQDVSTDGAKVAEALRKSAAQFRADYAHDLEAEGGGVAIVDFEPYGYDKPELAPSAWL